ncbi:hypothetical protein [Truepera radiovictrix]|uniref:Uncharacterized protein n=1 Tax=Truepera radiovictrix (strain DSM 17093 / CIP 108686 / LMG 22925 / RQ-24) TaxID=649638 RepID=D7CR72_TRURR|nr:hypothetical protein [Truepera radiovictrix]ADI15160.1 conserved hypothetical protein [Truepera radiovictrix DSM 17093]WMT56287.1 hypothetical protein RCV51_09760 [Truepera radiovictrix]
MLEAYGNETKVLVLHLANLELRLCALEGLSRDEAIAQTTDAVRLSLGAMRNTLLPDDEVETLKHLIAAQYDRLAPKEGAEVLKAS